MANSKKILFITGTRADFGKLKPLMREVDAAPELDCYIFATGMHMLARYGRTVQEIQESGFKSVFPFMNEDGSASPRMDIALAHTIHGIADYARELGPDLIVVHGDRVEALAGAAVGALTNTLVAHIEGGEVSGTVDDLIRHAVTKLAHVHFVANGECAQRLLQMGEEKRSVFAIGSPDIDVMLSDSVPHLAQVRERYQIPFEAYSILIYHPVTTELELIAIHAGAVVEAAIRSRRNFVVVYPNNDHGSDAIFAAYRGFESNPRFRVLPSMRFEYFLSLLRGADVILGNSSAGIREAPVYGVPTINVGSRQSERSRHVSITNVPEDAEAILLALTSPPAGIRSLRFGDGASARRFLQCLRAAAFWQTPRQKRFRDCEPSETLAPAREIFRLAVEASGAEPAGVSV